MTLWNDFEWIMKWIQIMCFMEWIWMNNDTMRLDQMNYAMLWIESSGPYKTLNEP